MMTTFGRVIIWSIVENTPITSYCSQSTVQVQQTESGAFHINGEVQVGCVVAKNRAEITGEKAALLKHQSTR